MNTINYNKFTVHYLLLQKLALFGHSSQITLQNMGSFKPWKVHIQIKKGKKFSRNKERS